MKTKIAPMAAAILALATVTTPLSAMPLPSPVQAPAAAPETTAQPVAHRRGFHAVGGVWYYNGHRGFVVARPGYRYYRGYWFPAAAFAAGAAAGAAITAPPAPYRRPVAAHVAWCYDTYRSYRAYDNTYQPYEGPRRQCWSPYS
ncbi:BA14K family protein [Mesorhizobium sp. KR9-304]|uniref:BA14K family protein n=1 Tax=Mesorhizobium sp. KR9-304 TaxID=3156614 RepID=UPI0032B5BCC4